MEAMNYLQIVNRALSESKVSLDPLTASNFLDPPRTILYNRFKDWANTAYEELYEERPQWFFRKERALVVIEPRLHLGGVHESIAVGDVLRAQNSFVEFIITDVHGVEEAEQNEELELTVSVEYLNGTTAGELLIHDVFDRVGDVIEPAMAHLVGLGYYDFQELVPGLEAVDRTTAFIADIPSPDLGSRVAVQGYNRILRDIPWPSSFEVVPLVGTSPQYISESPQGLYAIFPQPSEPILIGFDYTRKIQRMVNAIDYPEALPKRFHMYLVWKTVEEFADFDNNAALFRRAQKHVNRYSHYLHRDELQEIKFAPSRFNY